MSSDEDVLKNWNKIYPDIEEVEFYPLQQVEKSIFICSILALIFLGVLVYIQSLFLNSVNGLQSSLIIFSILEMMMA